MKNRKHALVTLLSSACFFVGCDVAPPYASQDVPEHPSQPAEGEETTSDPLVDPVTIGTLWKWAGYVEKAWSHFKRIETFYNGEDADLALVINNAKEEILSEMRGRCRT
jgi:hypothetical protein